MYRLNRIQETLITCNGKQIIFKDFSERLKLECIKDVNCQLCSSDQKFSIYGLANHIENDCPKQRGSCKRCKYELERGEYDSHPCADNLLLAYESQKVVNDDLESENEKLGKELVQSNKKMYGMLGTRKMRELERRPVVLELEKRKC